MYLLIKVVRRLALLERTFRLTYYLPPEVTVPSQPTAYRCNGLLNNEELTYILEAHFDLEPQRNLSCPYGVFFDHYERYQTVFIEGKFHIGGNIVKHQTADEDFKGDWFMKMNQTVCAQIEQWRVDDALFEEIPIACSLYSVDLNDLVVVQLSILDRDICELDMQPDEPVVIKAIAKWLKRVKPTVAGNKFVAKVINPGQHYEPSIDDSPKFGCRVETKRVLLRVRESMNIKSITVWLIDLRVLLISDGKFLLKSRVSRVVLAQQFDVTSGYFDGPIHVVRQSHTRLLNFEFHKFVHNPP
ncbi:unnamed protein product [Echinostoma caproni]|uniref:FBA_1 domain-containing protein n=1 Tax=Echinostoma caproni TaxID=27848 RepID=A0A183AH90_9TREM|nr:unnamed protein product [Echinostoma caproni]